MRAVSYARYGSPDVMEMTTVDRPVVGDNSVLIQVAATSLNRSDWETLVGSPFYVRINGLRAPRTKVLGSDVAGVVAEVGAAVTEFRPGDEVFGDVMYHGMGTFAEYVSVEESAPIVIKPPDVSFEQAATLPQSAVLAVQGLRTHGA
ncbi:MAG: alcohol dehydrogenase catalytic domain-containing protein, partial [Acidimicrobiia bacterium]|nr:alcohol dehydrogenase catalytic domain-containing protein [Acidimicrobiia bacterium]